jgi:hypothetical protein
MVENSRDFVSKVVEMDLRILVVNEFQNRFLSGAIRKFDLL